jgi:Big-like domain-containing protein
MFIRKIFLNCAGAIILLLKRVIPSVLFIFLFIFPIFTYAQTTQDENISTILNNATMTINNATNTLAGVAANNSKTTNTLAGVAANNSKTTNTLAGLASNISQIPKNVPIINTKTVVDAIFTSGLPVTFLSVIAAAMVIPLVIDLVLGHLKRPKQRINKQIGGPEGMPQLYRTLMTFGIILLVGTVIFYVLALITLSGFKDPVNPVVQSLIDVLKNLSTILGTALATIVAFYFGMRGAESAAEKAEARAAGVKSDKVPPVVLGTTPADGDKGVAVTTSVTATFDMAMLASTINENTFTVKKDGSDENIDGTVTLSSDAKTTIFDPVTDFDSKSKYIATINTEVKNLAGISLPSLKSWSFTTI